ncbi:MAG: NAD-binding protein, partial [Bacteroidales bacterium]
MKVKKIIVFGAGNIGRSFIGQLFNTGGYMVVFVDVNKEIINEMNKRGNYNVVIKSEYVSEVINVRNIKGIYAGNKKQVSEELIDSEIAAISVGT